MDHSADEVIPTADPTLNDDPTRPARSRLTPPRVWAGLMVLCLVVAMTCFVAAGVIRRTDSASGTVGDALATFSGVFLSASLFAFVGFVFGAARESSDVARTEHGVRSALVASGIVFMVALVGGGAVVAQTVEERLDLNPATTAPKSEPKGSGTSSTSVAPGAPAPAPANSECPRDALPGTC